MPFHSARSKASVQGSQALQMPVVRFNLPHFGGNEQNIRLASYASVLATFGAIFPSGMRFLKRWDGKTV